MRDKLGANFLSALMKKYKIHTVMLPCAIFIFLWAAPLVAYQTGIPNSRISHSILTSVPAADRAEEARPCIATAPAALLWTDTDAPDDDHDIPGWTSAVFEADPSFSSIVSLAPIVPGKNTNWLCALHLPRPPPFL
jgi:hypothetical protein